MEKDKDTLNLIIHMTYLHYLNFTLTLCKSIMKFKHAAPQLNRNANKKF